MTLFLGIDPGEQTGLAVYDARTKRVLWWHLGFPWATPQLVFPKPNAAAIEIPRIYPGKGNRRPQDLITLAVTAGELKHWARTLGLEATELHPQEWKGQLPKPATAKDPYIVTHRIKARAACDLWPDALPGSLAHNVYDAIGIAMHSAGHEIK